MIYKGNKETQVINIKDFIDFSLYEAKTEAKENRVKDYLLFN